MNKKQSPLLESIKKTPFFDVFSEEEKWRFVEKGGRLFKRYEQKGLTIFSEGDIGDSMFVVLSGAIIITKLFTPNNKKKITRIIIRRTYQTSRNTTSCPYLVAGIPISYTYHVLTYIYLSLSLSLYIYIYTLLYIYIYVYIPIYSNIQDFGHERGRHESYGHKTTGILPGPQNLLF